MESVVRPRARCADRGRRPAVTLGAAISAVAFLAGCGPAKVFPTERVTGSTTTSAAPTPMKDAAGGIYDPYAGTAPAVPAVGRLTEGRIGTADGRTRRYRLYVPALRPAGERIPLVVALHGGLGSSEQFRVNSGLDGLAEANGFAVVYPDGIGAGPNDDELQTWNGGYCCGPAARGDVDDVGFIRLLLDELDAELPVDPSRVYAAGHSNGAIMAYRLACELADRIAAVGVQAGSLGVDACTPSRPVSVFHLHGTADGNHPIGGGDGRGVAGVEFRSARAAVEALATVDGCVTAPTTEVVPWNPDVRAVTWSPCGARTAVRFVTVEGASHAWMGRPPYSARASSFVGEPYPGLDASRAIVSFLLAHPRE